MAHPGPENRCIYRTRVAPRMDEVNVPRHESATRPDRKQVGALRGACRGRTIVPVPVSHRSDDAAQHRSDRQPASEQPLRSRAAGTLTGEGRHGASAGPTAASTPGLARKRDGLAGPRRGERRQDVTRGNFANRPVPGSGWIYLSRSEWNEGIDKVVRGNPATAGRIR